jgi:hypothetical protein
LSTVDVFVNSKADHGLAPLEAGRVYAPVLCTPVANKAAELVTSTYYFGGTTALVNEVGDVPSARIPVRGSAEELLSVRTGG